ncbi:MAG: amino acid-binding protein [Blautia coccoides]
MFIEQLSIFLENRPGKLKGIADALKEKNINIISLGLSDTTDYGIARMIVSDSARAKQVLLEKGMRQCSTCACSRTAAGGRRAEPDSGYLKYKGLNLEYMYALVTGKGRCYGCETSDQARTYQTLKDAGMKMFSEEELNELKNKNWIQKN